MNSSFFELRRKGLQFHIGKRVLIKRQGFHREMESNSRIDSFREREQERTEDALASRDDEGRGKLRKVAGICTQELIREYPNGATRQAEGLSPTLVGANAGN